MIDIKYNFFITTPNTVQSDSEKIVLSQRFTDLEGLSVSEDTPLRFVLYRKEFNSPVEDINREIFLAESISHNTSLDKTELGNLKRGEEGTNSLGHNINWSVYILAITPTAETFKQLEQTGYELYTAVQVSGAWSPTKNTDGTDNAGNTGQDNYQIDLEGDSYFIIYTSTNNKYTQATMRIDNAQTGSIIFTTPTEI